MDTMLGSTLGGYKLVTELGSGGMGTVYYAEHLVIGRRAAIKVLRPEVSRDEDSVSRFITEARAANDIRHPNVVPITDIGQTEDGSWFIVMDLLEGETLGERLERSGRCDEPSAVRIARQVASALGAAHDRGVVHRDLKPENIFITNHPDYPDYVKLLDFGIAKLTGHSMKVSHQTAAGMLLGTPAYMSPEQCRGQTDLDHRSDIYSLGIVLYEMLTGSVPFKGDNIGAIIIAHAVQEPKPPRALNPEISPRLNALIMRALEKDPGLRFASMRELRDALEDRPATPAPPARTPQPARPQTPDEKKQTEVVRKEATPVVDRLTTILLDRIANDRLALPAMPGVAMECLSAARDPLQTFGKVATLAGRDPLLTSRILKLANSAAFPSRVPANTLEQAISRMGIEGLTIALVEFSVEEVFTSRNDRIQASFRGVWEHSLATALLAKDLVLLASAGDANGAYLGGLLHDVGKPVVAAVLLEAERRIAEEEPDWPWMSEAVWRRVVTSSHRTVGAALAERWKLPEPVREAIRNESDFTPDNPTSIVNFVRLANALTKREGLYLGEIDATAVGDTIAAGAKLLGFDEATLARACQDLRSRVGTLVKPEPTARARTVKQKRAAV